MATGAECAWRALRVDHTWHVNVTFALGFCRHDASAQQGRPGLPHSAGDIAATDVASTSICSTSTAGRHLVIVACKGSLPFRTATCCMSSQRWSHVSFVRSMPEHLWELWHVVADTATLCAALGFFAATCAARCVAATWIITHARLSTSE